MKKALSDSMALAVSLSVSFFTLESAQAQANALVGDAFDDDNIETNTNGIGSGFNIGLHNLSNSTVTEAEGQVTITSGGGGAARQQIASIETIDAGTSTAAVATFTVEDFGRDASTDNNTTRHTIGLVSSPNSGGNGITNSGVFENQLTGLWIGLQIREDAGGLTGLDNGQGALIYTSGSTNTVLASWTWSQDLVMWDAESTNRSDRIEMELLSPLTLTLSSNETSYALSFATTGTGTLPANISGTWAAAGVTNDLTSVHAAVYSQGNSGSIALSSISVTESDNIGSSYDAWAAGFPSLTNSTPDLDFDSDGLTTGIEWVVGGNPTMNDVANLAPTPDDSDPNAFQVVFRRSDLANEDPNTTIFIEYSPDLSPDNWVAAQNGVDGISISSDDDFFGAGIDRVTVSIPRALALNSKLFARLAAEVSNP